MYDPSLPAQRPRARMFYLKDPTLSHEPARVDCEARRASPDLTVVMIQPSVVTHGGSGRSSPEQCDPADADVVIYL